MKIARDGLPTIAALAFMSAGGYLVSHWITAALACPLILSLWFYRDPERAPGDVSGDAWLSPADGHVVEIGEASDPYAGDATRIGIFMNGFDVHVNRFPFEGTVEEIVYVPGRKWFAIAPKSSELNERLYVRAITPRGRMTLVQIAGILARRIICHTKHGSHLARGERYGMMKLGSRVDIYLPSSISPSVKIGDKVRAGETVIGVVK